MTITKLKSAPAVYFPYHFGWETPIIAVNPPAVVQDLSTWDLPVMLASIANVCVVINSQQWEQRFVDKGCIKDTLK